MCAAPRTVNVPIEQLCIGLYVHLDIPWLDHSFALSSFKIKTEQELRALKQLGVPTIRVNPVKSDCRPLPPPAPSAEPKADPEKLELTEEEQEKIREKKARIDRLIRERNAIAECEKQLLKTATALKNINRNLFSRPQESVQQAEQLVEQMVDSLLIDKDIAIHLMNDKIAGEDTYYHSLNTAVLTMMLAKELSFSREDLKLLGMGCLFHDIGKMEIPDRVVNKTFQLTKAEMHLMQQHCYYGLKIADKLSLPKQVRDIIAQHHEYIDGSGYPEGLKGDAISPLARIVAITNAYDNLCNRPNYQESMSPHEAMAYMFSQLRKQFDVPALNLFIRSMGIYPPGTIVKLSDGTLGMVIAVNSQKPLRPSVLIYDPSVPKNEAIILDLMHDPLLEITQSMKPGQLSPEIHDYLSPRKRMTYFFDSERQVEKN
ncbi:HD-GYP domain-containing protein [Undibacterium oligocarboniphilum]|uniref:HD-GYP domain-containing protein n=1 Tax=Undibacterium oligocarboniphilum TaxID=666702 RepID=A0A850QQU0_9BURK|nr:HD-GYP domain-containing protein [Undibacterium oligocarboniphilum]MBC3871651.1 HD-GYP domain-containing protein [Undibacterium oligocarboniphilum]NVO79160.1 HD-GYP domain-containing protein [Undibacterium oligocarboniphilum]